MNENKLRKIDLIDRSYYSSDTHPKGDIVVTSHLVLI